MFKKIFFNKKPAATRRLNNNIASLSVKTNTFSNFLLTFLIGVSTGITITFLIIILSNYSNLFSKINLHSINLLRKKSENITTKPPHDKSLITNKYNLNTTSSANNYDFYNLLPNNIETSINNNDNITNKIATTDPTAPHTTNNNTQLTITNKHYLELGIFTTTAEADRLKAQLLLHGFDNIITKNITTTENTPEYKVMLGPFDSQATALLKKEQLISAGFESNLIK